MKFQNQRLINFLVPQRYAPIDQSECFQKILNKPSTSINQRNNFDKENFEQESLPKRVLQPLQSCFIKQEDDAINYLQKFVKDLDPQEDEDINNLYKSVKDLAPPNSFIKLTSDAIVNNKSHFIKRSRYTCSAQKIDLEVQMDQFFTNSNGVVITPPSNIPIDYIPIFTNSPEKIQKSISIPLRDPLTIKSMNAQAYDSLDDLPKQLEQAKIKLVSLMRYQSDLKKKIDFRNRQQNRQFMAKTEAASHFSSLSNLREQQSKALEVAKQKVTENKQCQRAKIQLVMKHTQDDKIQKANQIKQEKQSNKILIQQKQLENKFQRQQQMISSIDKNSQSDNVDMLREKLIGKTPIKNPLQIKESYQMQLKEINRQQTEISLKIENIINDNKFGRNRMSLQLNENKGILRRNKMSLQI